MIHHDITRNYGGSMENTARVISTEVLIIVAEKDYLIYPAPSIELAKILNAGLVIPDSDCGHPSIGCELERCSGLINAFFAGE